MSLLYALAFCRITLAFTFALSAITKASNIPSFKQTIARFGLLPERLHMAAALALLGGEFAAALLLAAGGALLPLGFALALALCLAFTLALRSVLARGMRVACNCFGASARAVSADDIRRNLGLIACALGGLGLIAMAPDSQAALSGAEWGLVGASALVAVAVWLQLGEIVQLFRHT
ncbi:MAG TPA: MauE/DoxX family redox-associated membrane protein [Herpetosiphonaceae bacterium]|nr:MauE/DoxX family redox-associated membrane protein [Herpetosiphonaceae bacterium]